MDILGGVARTDDNNVWAGYDGWWLEISICGNPEWTNDLIISTCVSFRSGICSSTIDILAHSLHMSSFVVPFRSFAERAPGISALFGFC